MGGIRIYETMRRLLPDFFVHSGDTIYADGPMLAERPTETGRVWKNVVTEAKSKVAETLEESRGNNSLQPAGPQRPALQRQGAADLAVGRP